MRPPRFVLPALGLLLSIFPADCRADWRDDLSPPQPGDFPALRPLQADYQCGWSGFSAADVQVKFTHPDPATAALEAKAATTGFVRTLWRLDATHTARADLATLKPIELHQAEVYRYQTIHTALQFTGAGVAHFRESTADKNPARHKTYEFPGLYDLQTALLYVRSQKLQAGQTFRLPVYPATSPYLAIVTVLGREKIKVKAGTYPAIKLDLKLEKITSGMALEPHPKFKRATGWLSDDEDRIPLRMNAQIFVGTVWVELARPPQPAS